MMATPLRATIVFYPLTAERGIHLRCHRLEPAALLPRSAANHRAGSRDRRCTVKLNNMLISIKSKILNALGVVLLLILHPMTATCLFIFMDVF